jgi:hypothetical protein
MKESNRTVPMLYERNDSYVIEAFRRGEFDYLEGVGEVSEVDFFRALTGKNVLRKLSRYVSLSLQEARCSRVGLYCQ